MTSIQTRLAQNRRGTSAVEFAILSPLFILMLTGMSAYGIYLGAAHAVQQLTADAARTAVGGLDSAERTALATGYVSRNAGGYAFLNPSQISVSAAPSSADPAQFVVSVRYDARHLPIWSLLPDLPMPSVVIERRSTIRAGGI